MYVSNRVIYVCVLCTYAWYVSMYLISGRPSRTSIHLYMYVWNVCMHAWCVWYTWMYPCYLCICVWYVYVSVVCIYICYVYMCGMHGMYACMYVYSHSRTLPNPNPHSHTLPNPNPHSRTLPNPNPHSP